ncbi:MAG: DUF58 domain-containing protein [Desulfobacteraceae bacterium]|nr:DUF58 domain-containing protein [Desulfobacteraceae bacterium]
MRFAPSTKFLVFFAAACIALTFLELISGLDKQATYFVILAFAGVAAVDIYISKSLHQKVSIVFPELVRMSKNKETSLAFTVFKHNSSPKRIIIGMVFPNDRFESFIEKEISLDLDEKVVEWPITGKKQGCFKLEACYIETRSLIGLWALRRKLDIHCELRIYPDMSLEKKALAALFLDFGFGVHAQRSIGKGREFEQLREYVPGDLYEDMHWKATARRGIPVSKIYQIERTQDVYVIIDAARMSARNAQIFSGTGQNNGSESESILEKYITTALSVGMAAEKQGDNFGIGVFSDHMERFIPAGSRKAHYNLCRDALYTVEPKKVTPDFTECITFIGNKIRKRSLLIILTSLDDPAIAESFLNHIHILSRRHLVMVNMLNPLSARPLFSTGDINSVDDIFGHLGGHIAWNFLQEFERSMHRIGIGFFLHANRTLTVKTISQYLNIKQRQSL